MPSLPCRTDLDRGSCNDGLCCVLKEKERLSNTQERPKVFDNRTPALLNQTFFSSHELHHENQRKEGRKEKRQRLAHEQSVSVKF